MGLSLQKKHLKRYKDIAWLLIKYGNSDLVKNAGLEEVLTREEQQEKGDFGANADELATDLEKLGPTFIKLGQLLSTRPDFIPPVYLNALSRLQDHCEVFPFSEVEKIVVNELGVRMSRAFSEFSEEPIAAASLGQIHHAVMRNGREVVVKIQRPGIRESTIEDLEALADIADFYDKHTKVGKRYEFSVTVNEFRKSILAELDYQKEAHNLITLRENLEEFELIVVPSPVHDYSTSKVLTMDFIPGKKITSVSGFKLLDIDGGPLAEEVFKAYLKQILVDGFFHADPHPGNVFITHDNKIALIDLGMVAYLTPHLQDQIFQLLLALAENRPDTAADICKEIGTLREKFDEAEFRQQLVDLVHLQLEGDLEDMSLGKVVLGVTTAAGKCAIRVPPELTMLGKTLLNLDQVGRTLYPKFDVKESVKKNASDILERRMEKIVSAEHIFRAAIDAKNYAEKLPGTMMKILDLTANNKLRIKVDTIDEALLLDAFQKVANRISLGLVLAALIVGASLLMRVQTKFTIFGYPGLAIICFLAAASAGFLLIAHIGLYDRKTPEYDDDK
jgi:predicted unusual protein kinase regulating ubiquinone biosynthesis (AarF/ABC1/UbiB family)